MGNGLSDLLAAPDGAASPRLTSRKPTDPRRRDYPHHTGTVETGAARSDTR